MKKNEEVPASSTSASIGSHSASDGRSPNAVTPPNPFKPTGTFASKAYFDVSPETFDKGIQGRKHRQHWRTYIGNTDFSKNMRQWSKTHGNPDFFLRNKSTGEIMNIRNGGKPKK